ncbi:MAG TPA: dihydrofolate reductase family protein, partial [Candidatus Dormibacteraeota bacterium]|nr:dihydrofolate reductase family protein [Candidatus Dormibacteraeota bacterium]
DDPELSARVNGSDARQPLRVVLDSRLRTPEGAKVVGPNTLIATTRPGKVGAAETLLLPSSSDGQVELSPLLDELGRRGILSVLVEGGAAVHASFFAQGLVDKVQAYVAPIVIGGREATGPVGGKGITNLVDAIHLSRLDTTRIGDDLLISGYVDVHRHS